MSIAATRSEIAKRLYGARQSMASVSSSMVGGTTGGISGSLGMRYGVATADSADGWVTVKLDNSEEVVTCVCDSPIKAGQRVTVLITDSGQLKAVPIGDSILDDAVGQIGNPVVDTDLEWAGSDSGDEAPTEGWSQSWPSGSLYVWQRQRVEKRDGTVTYSVPVVVSRPQEGYEADATFYATSSSSASTSAKTATVQEPPGFALKEGVVVSVKFTNANTASSPTLNVDGTGAKAIRTLGTSSAYWAAGQTVLFVYDGTYWQVASAPVWASTVTVGNPASRNVYIDSSHVAIRNGTTEFSTFDSNNITLGRTNSGSMLRLSSDGTATFYDAGDDVLTISADSSGARMETTMNEITLLNRGGSSITLGNGGISFSKNGTMNVNRVLSSMSSYSTFPFIANCCLLYSSSSGVTGDVSLKHPSSNYWRIDIYFSDGSRVQMASTCGSTTSSSISSSCSGRYVSLVRAVSSGSSVMYISSEQVLVTGSEIQRTAQCLQTGIRNGSCELASGTHRIVAVVGWSL